MALRQYVGARYVPKFSDVNEGVWDDSYTYEPLTIVKHGNDYYTSKKEVPTGIAITNTEYWVLTGNYNGAISELHDEIDEISGDLSTLNTTVTEIVSKVENLTGRYFLLIGDSLGNGYTPGVAEADRKGWGYWCKRYIEAAGGQCYYSTSGGAGFATANPWLSHIQNNPDIAAIKDQITDVVILGGTNDIALNDVSAAQLTNGIDAFFAFAVPYFPNAKFNVGILTSVLVSVSSSTSGTIAKYRDTCKYGAAYLSDLENLFSNPDYVSSDNVHLTQEGYAVLSPYVFDCIVNKHTTYKFRCRVLETTFGEYTLAYRLFYTQNSVMIQMLRRSMGGDYVSCEIDVTAMSGYTEAHAGSFVDFITLPQYTPLNVSSDFSAFSGVGSFFVCDNGRRNHFLGNLTFANWHVDDASNAKIQIELPLKVGDWGGADTAFTSPTRWITVKTLSLFT